MHGPPVAVHSKSKVLFGGTALGGSRPFFYPVG